MATRPHATEPVRSRTLELPSGGREIDEEHSLEAPERLGGFGVERSVDGQGSGTVGVDGDVDHRVDPAAGEHEHERHAAQQSQERSHAGQYGPPGKRGPSQRSARRDEIDLNERHVLVVGFGEVDDDLRRAVRCELSRDRDRAGEYHPAAVDEAVTGADELVVDRAAEAAVDVDRDGR